MTIKSLVPGLKPRDVIVKRSFDLLLSIVGLMLSGWVILLAWTVASYDTRSNGFFRQDRVGKNRKIFSVIKIKTMINCAQSNSTVTVQNDVRITKSGQFFRRTKIDELPQLINILLGDMSFVGPRPDVPGFADTLQGDDRIILSIRPGITGPATLKYRDEEALLAGVDSPEEYNKKVIYPDKIRINKEYIKNYSLRSDLKYIFNTIFH